MYCAISFIKVVHLDRENAATGFLPSALACFNPLGKEEHLCNQFVVDATALCCLPFVMYVAWIHRSILAVGRWGGETQKKGGRVVHWRMPVANIDVELHSSSTGVCTSQKCHADNVPLVNVR